MDDKIHSLRDALEWLDRDIEDESAVDGEMSNANAIRIGFIRNMLARFPLRNCEVGTAEEQSRRFLKYCVKQDCEKTCPFRDCKNSHECAFAWAQMPYEEGGVS